MMALAVARLSRATANRMRERSSFAGEIA